MNEASSTDEQLSLMQLPLAMRRAFVKERLRYIASLQHAFLRAEPWIDKRLLRLLYLKNKQLADGTSSVKNKFTTPKSK